MTTCRSLAATNEDTDDIPRRRRIRSGLPFPTFCRCCRSKTSSSFPTSSSRFPSAANPASKRLIALSAKAGSSCLRLNETPELEEPKGVEDFHEIGTAALIMRMLKLPDGRIRILVQGLCRARLEHPWTKRAVSVGQGQGTRRVGQ